MKIKQSLLAILLVLTMVLAACGNGNGNSTTDASNSANGSSSETGTDLNEGATGSDEKVNGIMYKEGLPIVDPGDYKFSIFVDGTNDSPEDIVMLGYLKEQTNVDVELRFYPYEVAQEKLSLELNSGDYADCIGGWILNANDILTGGVRDGMYIPLEDYFEEYCPNITNVLEIEDVRNTMTTPDGHIYSVPYVLGAPQVDFLPYINTKWLENLNLEVPTTTEEFVEVLRAFKNEDANGNGDPNDEIPFSADANNRNRLGYLCGWFGMSVNPEGFTMVGDQLTFGAASEEYKEGVKFLAELYSEGLMDTEMFTQDLAQWKAKGADDLYGVCFMYGAGDIMPFKDGEEPDWAPLPVLSSPSTPNPVFFANTNGTDVLKNQVVITDKAEHPEIICRWWDNAFELENSIAFNDGPVGITIDKTETGYKKIDMDTLSEDDFEKYQWSNLWLQSMPRFIPLDFELEREVPVFPEKDIADAAYEPYLLQPIPRVWTPTESASEISELTTSIRDYIMQKRAEWISGQADIDKEWDAYISQLDKLNLPRFVELREAVMYEG